LISGDSEQAAQTIAKEADIAIENVRAAVLPDQKVDKNWSKMSTIKSTFAIFKFF
jgi:cation transport ATPase